MVYISGFLTIISLIFDLSSSQKASPKNEKHVWAIYNPLFGNPTNDGKYIGWRYKKYTYMSGWYEAPFDLPTKLFPQLGLYSTHDATVLQQQMKEMVQSGINGLIVLWNGYNVSTQSYGEPELYSDQTISLLLEVAKPYNMHIGIMIQDYFGRDANNIRSNVEYITKTWSQHKQYLRYQNRPVIAVYDPHKCNTLFDAIEKINKKESINPFIIGTFSLMQHVAEGVETGLDAIYSYFPAINQTFSSTISKWKNIQRECEERGIMFIPGVGPGLNEAITETSHQSTWSRTSGSNYEMMWKEALHYNKDIVIINSFNNWIEGTNIEPAINKPEKAFSDSLWSGEKGNPDDFLVLTKKWASNFFQNNITK